MATAIIAMNLPGSVLLYIYEYGQVIGVKNAVDIATTAKRVQELSQSVNNRADEFEEGMNKDREKARQESEYIRNLIIKDEERARKEEERILDCINEDRKIAKEEANQRFCSVERQITLVNEQIAKVRAETEILIMRMQHKLEKVNARLASGASTSTSTS